MTNDIIGFDSKSIDTNFRVYDKEAIKTDLKNEIMTMKGERVMIPEYGSLVWDYIFENITDDEDIQYLIKEDITRIFAKDPRVELKNIQLYDEEHMITVNTDIKYNPDGVRDTLYLRFKRMNFNN